MHEIWLQKYIKEHFHQLGFARLHGPYSVGADFKGIYAQKPVKVEAEWDYSDYITHKHPLNFADILVVATLESVPEHLKARLPSLIIHLDREQVIDWAQPRLILKTEEDFYAYPWRRFSANLLYLYAYYQKREHPGLDFIGSNLARSMSRLQKPQGFQFAAGGKQEGFEGPPEDKASWDYWLDVAHAVASHFKLKPALLRPTWIDRLALYFKHTGRITDAELKHFQDIALFIDDLILKKDL